VGLSVILHRAPPQVADRGHSLDTEVTGEIKYPGRTRKLTNDGLPRGNQDLGRSVNCKLEAALAILTIGGDEINRYSYRSETDRPTCRLLHCDVEGKKKLSHYDLKEAIKRHLGNISNLLIFISQTLETN
jgi:hypothetical protein